MGLTTISYNHKACKDVFQQLHAIIGDITVVRSLSYSDLSPGEKVADDLILITTPVIKHLVLPFIKPGCRYITARRTINPQRMSQLFDIPANAEVLVVNVLFESAVDLIQELQTIGIRHAKFFPYDPNLPLTRKFSIAVTPGEAHLVPPEIPHIIDIGDRHISIASISQILYHLTGAWMDDALINARYIQNYVKLSIDLADQSRYNQSLRRQVEMVVANFEDGVVLTDKSQRITYHNAKALELLAQNSITGLKLGQVLPAGNLKNDGAFLSVNHRALHITRKAVDLPADNQTEMLIIKDLTSIRHIDEQFRKQKKYSGYTAKYTFPDIIHQSKSIKALIRKARALAETDSSVLMIGESGTGKELFAQSIHNASHRRGNPFVALNCAALSETLLESELFGYAEGAFTGARKGGKIGLFEMAHKGTIFLDEIGDAPLATQKKLLRVLQEKEIMRVAGDNVTPIDVRVIAATNKNLAELVAARQFREDLFYRLNVFPLYVPSLRERKDDINPLIEWFINKYSLQHKRSLPRLDPAIYRLLHDYEWPGNIRQLENIAEFIVTVSSVSDDLYSDVLQILTMSAVRHEQARPALAGQPEGRLRELRAILAVLNDNSSHRIGRSTIRKLLLEHGFSLSEQQIKTRLAALKKLHFVESDNGKGTMLAPAGCKYLEQSER